jgi:hypothetical protein
MIKFRARRGMCGVYVEKSVGQQAEWGQEGECHTAGTIRRLNDRSGAGPVCYNRPFSRQRYQIVINQHYAEGGRKRGQATFSRSKRSTGKEI